MIYRWTKSALLRALKAPTDPPDPPPGSPGSAVTFRAAPNFLRLRIIVWGLSFAAAIVFEIIFLIGEHFVEIEQIPSWMKGTIGIALVVLTLMAGIWKYFIIRLDYDMRYYIVTDRSVRIREGVLIIHEATFTFANVQNLRITEGPVERLLGISNLVVETAGGAGPAAKEKGPDSPFSHGHQGVFRGVANAREVRDQIQALLKDYRDAGLGDPDDARRTGHRAAAGGGVWSPEHLERLREIRDALPAIS